MAETLPATKEAEVPKLSAQLEKALVEGDLRTLTVEQRVEFYNATCQSLGLNPLTKPFGYIVLNGKLTLYALKACSDQLRDINGVSIRELREEPQGDVYVVWATAVDRDGRTDCDLGAVPIKGLTGEALCNAKMKAVTKAKRRVTLSICGLGMLDETEVTTIPGARRVEENAEVQPVLVRPRRLGAPKVGPPPPHPYQSDCECDDCMIERDRREMAPSDKPRLKKIDTEKYKPVEPLTPEENAKLDRELAAEEQAPLFGEDMASEMRDSGERSGPFISQPQVARLMTIAKAAGETEAGVMARLENQYGIVHRNKIPRVLYDAIVAGFERKSHTRIVRR